MSALTKFTHIVSRYRLAEVYAFGSRAKAVAESLLENKIPMSFSHSDVDIGVRIQPGKTLSPSERVKLAIELEDLLGVSGIDLVVISEAEPFLAVEIMRGELLFVKDFDSQARYELYVLRRAADLVPYKKERVRMILEDGAR